MPRLNIESFGVVCGIEADEPLLQQILEDRFTKHYIPGANYVDLEPSIKLIQTNMIKPVALDYPVALFREGLGSRDVVTIAEYLLERARQTKGLYSLSSSSASKNDQSVIFWGGATNLGKTSSMIKLVKDYDLRFVSDEKTILCLLDYSVMGGSESIPIRKEIIGELVDCKLGQFYEPNKIMRSKSLSTLMIQPHLDEGREKPIISILSPHDFYWLFVRELSQAIRGTTRLVDNFRYQLPPLDTEDLSQKRLAEARKFSDKVPCFYFQGSLDQIGEFVNNRLQ